MRIKAGLIITLFFGLVLMAYLLIDNQTLSSIQIDTIKTVCLECHGYVPTYNSKVVRVHDIHSALDCSRCHKDSGPIVPSNGQDPEQAPSLLPSEEPDSEQAPPPLPDVGPPKIPHTLQGHDKCLVCHDVDDGFAVEIPADHAGRTNRTCTTCHVAIK